MKPGATRDQIIRVTGELIVRHGIRALRVDEIVQRLGISKRTLYEMFVDKTNLITVCLNDLSQRQRERIEACEQVDGDHPLHKLFRLLGEYIEAIYRVGGEFLTDLKHRSEYAPLFEDNRDFWVHRLRGMLDACVQEGLLEPAIDRDLLTSRLMETMYRTRTEGVPRDEQYVFCRLLIRGCARSAGIEWIDRMPPERIAAL